jgi:hypothetical protein
MVQEKSVPVRVVKEKVLEHGGEFLELVLKVGGQQEGVGGVLDFVFLDEMVAVLRGEEGVVGDGLEEMVDALDAGLGFVAGPGVDAKEAFDVFALDVLGVVGVDDDVDGFPGQGLLGVFVCDEAADGPGSFVEVGEEGALRGSKVGSSKHGRGDVEELGAVELGLVSVGVELGVDAKEAKGVDGARGEGDADAGEDAVAVFVAVVGGVEVLGDKVALEGADEGALEAGGP